MSRKAAVEPKWNFYLDTNKSTGIQYVQTSYNIWVPEKKQPRLGGKAYVGRLFPDGSVRPSKTFLERFPQYADKKLYYFENQLVDREGYLKLNPNAEAQWEELQSQEKTAEQQQEERRESIENDWRCTARQCGLTSAAWSFLAESDLLKDLEDMLGKEDARVIGALAVYMLDKGVSMNSFADWLGRVYIPGVKPICGQRLSELLAKIEPDMVDNFFLKRHQRAITQAQARRRELKAKSSKAYIPPLTLAFDSTSISTYSGTIDHAEYGYAKRDPHLKQVNLALACDQDTGEVVYACEYFGSIDDKTSFKPILERMQKVGFDMSETLLITDRGYKSMSNIQKQLDVGLKFLQCTPLNEKSVRALIDKHSSQLKGIEFYEPKYHCSAVALPTEECESWSQRLPGSGSTQSVKVSVYLYYDDHKAVDEKHCEMAAIDRVLELKNAGSQVDAALWQEYRSCVQETQNHKGESVWVRKNQGIAQRLKYSGCMALRTNEVPNPFRALELYRQRNAVECSYRVFKNQIEGDRMLATQTSYRGKLFVFTLATCLRTMMRVKAEAQAKEFDLKIPGNSLSQVFEILRGVTMQRWGSTDSWRINMLTRKQRECFALFGMTPIRGTRKD